MPIYEFKCIRCGYKFEKMYLHIEDAEKNHPRCPKCNGHTKRLISSAGFILKGNGWYITEYPSPERKKAMEEEKKLVEKTNKSDNKKGKKDDKK